MDRSQVVVVGSGFGGTILARALHRRDIGVILVERHEHPRFAIGESSTPLAAICLERLAKRYAMKDLSWLAAYGRWSKNIPQIRRGLKRGFTFYGHRPMEEFRDNPENDRRLLVAASPDDAVADSHWLRADVDHFLVRQAIDDGVDFRDQLEIQSLERGEAASWRLRGMRRGVSVDLATDVIIDASGSGGFLASALPIPSAIDRAPLDTALVFGHFEQVSPFVETSPGPYPDERAAIHHLLDEGWMYVLPFDCGVISAGILLRRPALEQLLSGGVETPEAIWDTVLKQYPSLDAQFSRAVPTRPVALVPRVQRLLDSAAGPDWALMPHSFAFFDPMFSTGIAWSLIAVERLAGILETAFSKSGLDSGSLGSGLDRYRRQLRLEARQMAALLEGAYSAMPDFGLFAAQSFLYFGVVSYAEVDQRLRPEGRNGVSPAWQGFLGAGDSRLERVFREAGQRLKSIPRDANGMASVEDGEEFSRWIREVIAAQNIAGLADPGRHNLYPVDLDLLIDRAELLGMTGDEMRGHLPLLRGVSAGR